MSYMRLSRGVASDFSHFATSILILKLELHKTTKTTDQVIHAIKVPPTAITLSIRITCVLIELLWRNHQICTDPQHLYCIRAITIQIQVGDFKVT